MKKVIIPLILILFGACKSEQEQLNFFNKSLQNEAIKPLLNKLKNNLTDTLNNWMYKKHYENVQDDSGVWRVDDAIFLSPEKDKAIMMILMIDTTGFCWVPSENGDKLVKKTISSDLIKLIYANKESDGWHFYFQSMEGLIYFRDKRHKGKLMPLTFDELSIKGRRSLIRSYYRFRSYKFNNEFFDTWDVKMLKYMQRFLNGYFV